MTCAHPIRHCACGKRLATGTRGDQCATCRNAAMAKHCACGARLDRKNTGGRCRSCYRREQVSARVDPARKNTYLRFHHPVALADQIVGWQLHRGGWSMSDIAQKLRRTPAQTRRILYGEA